jgi:hypothetical protein
MADAKIGVARLDRTGVTAGRDEQPLIFTHREERTP